MICPLQVHTSTDKGISCRDYFLLVQKIQTVIPSYLTERLKSHVKLSAFLRYVDVTEGCVINEEMFVVLSHLEGKKGLD
jgi:hypothetical protein